MTITDLDNLALRFQLMQTTRIKLNGRVVYTGILDEACRLYGRRNVRDFWLRDEMLTVALER